MSKFSINKLAKISVLGSILILNGCVTVDGNSRRIESTPIAGGEALNTHYVEDIRSVDGLMVVSESSKIRDIRNINGTVVIESNATVRNIDVVSGNILVEERGAVNGNIKAARGAISIQDGSEIEGSIESPNGTINLAAARVQGNVQTTNGSIVLSGTVVEQDIIVRRSFGLPSFRKPEVIIGAGAEIRGSVIANNSRVSLYVHESAIVNNIEGTDPIPFSGDAP